MREVLKGFSTSLRFRMAVAVGLVLAVMLAVLAGNGQRLMQAALMEREDRSLGEMQALLSAALAAPLTERDYATAAGLVRQFLQQKKMTYAVLADQSGRVVAAEGWEPGKALPPPLESLSELSGGTEPFHGMARISSGDRVLGHLYFGIDTGFLREASSRLLWQNMAIGGAFLALTLFLLALAGYRLTRSLRHLQQGVVALEGGGTDVRIAVRSDDEIGSLTRAFNRMAQTLGERVAALKKSESRFHAIADFTYGVEAWFNPQGRLIWINRSVERITGYTPLECILSASLIEMLVFDKDRKHALEVGLKALRGSSGDNFEVRLKRKDGSILWVVINWQPIYGESSEYLGLRVSADEIQSRKEAELKLLDTVVELRRTQALKEYYLTYSNEERSRLEALLNVMKVGVLFVDSGHRIIYANKSCRRIWGFPEDENLTGARDTVVLDRTAELRADDAAYRRHLEEVLAGGGVSEPFEILLQDGRTIMDVTALVPGAKPGRHIGRVWIYEDVTQQKQLEAKLIQLAERDPLTNLYNRRRFHEELDRMIADASRRKTQAGLLAVDLDAFKPINDEFGHQAGDTVLTTLVAEVGSIVRRNEIFFRIGGDEFAILAPDTSEEEMIGLARRVGSRISGMRFSFNGRAARLTASLGIALFPQHAQNSEEIIARADSAMYQAKLSGKNRWAVYRDPMLHGP